LNRQFHRRSSTSLRRLSIVRLSCRPAPGFPRSRVLRLCLRSATDLRRQPILRRCQRPTSNFRRTLHSPASPSDSRLPACALVCISRLSFGISFQLAPSASSSSFPSNQPQLFVEPCIFQLYLPTAPPARAGSLSSVFAFGLFVPARAELLPSGFASESTPGSRRTLHPSALPSNTYPTHPRTFKSLTSLLSISGSRLPSIFRSATRPTSDLHRRSIVQLSLWTNSRLAPGVPLRFC